MESYERLQAVIDWAGMSTHAFALSVGMSRSENIYRIIRNKENVSTKLTTTIVDAYPQISRNWLSCGEGEMLASDESILNKYNLIPYHSDFCGNDIKTLKGIKPNFNLYIPTFKDADIAIMMNDQTMEPIIPFGSIVILSKKPTDIILFGHIYYIVTEDFTMVRIIRKSEQSNNKVILDVFNNERYDSIIIQKSKIKKMALVCGTVNQFI